MVNFFGAYKGTPVLKPFTYRPSPAKITQEWILGAEIQSLKPHAKQNWTDRAAIGYNSYTCIFRAGLATQTTKTRPC